MTVFRVALIACGLACIARLALAQPQGDGSAVNKQATPSVAGAAASPVETPAERDARMAWWREARFGLFIHWGLYAVPAGEWGGGTGHGEWILTTAQIPVEQYEKFAGQFNPVKFDAAAWVRMAKAAGMKYIVITSKHHDGFCLWDSEQTNYDVMATPFHRDILRELADACRKGGIRLCFYHSIMDWHHPDYLPRRDWEKRWAEGADFARYVRYMKAQLRELLTNYGDVGVIWFDGEWEGTWTHEHGRDLYDYVRSLSPAVIINNRVDKGRSGMAGMTASGDFRGDFGTPEQEIPATGFPGVDWESCMTMNEHWGYNRADDKWKSSRDLVRMLADIASKGGNYLLNIGPMASGEFPPEAVMRLEEIGKWMSANGDSIHGTQASPFHYLYWGRCTQRSMPDGVTRLYLHVFDWPADNRLHVPGLLSEARGAFVLSDEKKSPLNVERVDDALLIDVPSRAPDEIDSVVVLDVIGKPDVADPPIISAPATIFVDTLEVRVTTDRENVTLHYTLDGTGPTGRSERVSGPIRVSDTCTISARCVRDDRLVSSVAQLVVTKVSPRKADVAAADAGKQKGGLAYEYYEGDWDALPDFDKLKPAGAGPIGDFSFSPRKQVERFAFRYRGFVRAPVDGVYRFYTLSDDGSRLYVGDQLVVDNDGLHGALERDGVIALSAGLHAIVVTYFEKTGGDALEVSWTPPGGKKERLPASALFAAP